MTDSTEHPAPEQLDRFVRGEASQADSTAVVRHLLTRCPQCQKRTAALWYRSESAAAQLLLAPEKVRKRIAAQGHGR